MAGGAVLNTSNSSNSSSSSSSNSSSRSNSGSSNSTCTLRPLFDPLRIIVWEEEEAVAA
jgi:hypothetical protein